MDFQTRFAIFTAVGVASFSAGLSLTTACSTHVDAQPEKITLHPSLPTEVKPLPPLAEKPAVKASELTVETKPTDKKNDTRSAQPTDAPSVEKQALAPDQIAVRRLVVTHAVSEREPIEPAELVSGTPILAFVEVSNQDAVERNVVVTFERQGRAAVGHVKLHVPAKSPRFRTWARTRNLNVSGTWEVVVRSEDGTELGRQPFELERA